MKIPMGIPEWDFFDLLSTICSTLIKKKTPEGILAKSLQDFLDVEAFVLTDLGRQAIYIALKTLSLKPKDEVIIPSYACQNVILPVISVGCKPVFADCQPDLNICIDHVKTLINENTRVIIVPHLYGKIARIMEFSKFADEMGLILIDDAAQVFGAKVDQKYVGTFGTFGIFSFGPFKSIMATKGGALVVTKIEKSRIATPIQSNDIHWALSIAIKSWIKFRFRKYSHGILNKKASSQNNETIRDTGLNLTETFPMAMSELDANLISKLIPKVEAIINKRKALALDLTSRIENKDRFFTLPDTNENNIFTKYILFLNDKYLSEKDAFLSYLRQNGIEAHAGYYPLHMQKVFSEFVSHITLPVTERIWQAVLCLPICSTMKISHIKYMAKTINRYRWHFK